MGNTISLHFHPLEKCQMDTQEFLQVYLNGPFEKIERVNLSPGNIYQVRLLVVKKANKYVDIMFHFCLLDHEDVIIKYHKIQNNFKDSKLKSILGGYKVAPYCFNYKDYTNSIVTKNELSIQSVGLKITALQKNTLSKKLIQDYWFYNKSHYSFIDNNLLGLSKNLESTIESIIPFNFYQLTPNMYVNHLRKKNLLNIDDIFRSENLYNSSNQNSQKLVKLHNLKNELKSVLLNKCADLDIPEHLGFCKYDLVECILDEFELHRLSHTGRRMVASIELDLSAYKKAKIWVQSIIGSDQSLMDMVLKIHETQNSLSINI